MSILLWLLRNPTDASALSAYVFEFTFKRCYRTPFARLRSGVTVDETSACSSAGPLQENCRSSTDSASRQAGVAFTPVARLVKSLHSLSKLRYKWLYGDLLRAHGIVPDENFATAAAWARLLHMPYTTIVDIL